MLATAVASDHLAEDTLHTLSSISDEGWVSVQLLNTSSAAITLNLLVGEHAAPLTLAANALQTAQFVMPKLSDTPASRNRPADDCR